MYSARYIYSVGRHPRFDTNSSREGTMLLLNSIESCKVIRISHWCCIYSWLPHNCGSKISSSPRHGLLPPSLVWSRADKPQRQDPHNVGTSLRSATFSGGNDVGTWHLIYKLCIFIVSTTGIFQGEIPISCCLDPCNCSTFSKKKMQNIVSEIKRQYRVSSLPPAI